MCKKKIKIYVVMLLFIFIANISMSVHASTIDDIWTTGTNFIKMGENGGATFNGDNIESAVQDLYSLFWWAGLVIAVIVGAILGVKFMTEGAEGKAKIKEALIPFCIGCVVIFGGFAIWKIAMNLFNDLESEEITVTEVLTTECANGSHKWEKTSTTHKCEYCGLEQNHNFDGSDCTKCTKCYYICDHELYYDNAGINCRCKKCNFYKESCLYGYNGRKTEPHNYKNGFCTKCFMPENDYEGCKHWEHKINRSYSGGVCYTCEGCGKVLYCANSHACIYVERDGVQFCLKCFTKKN